MEALLLGIFDLFVYLSDVSLDIIAVILFPIVELEGRIAIEEEKIPQRWGGSSLDMHCMLI